MEGRARDATARSDPTPTPTHPRPTLQCARVPRRAGATVVVSNSGWSDSVVWNPGPTMPACFDNFVCVENAKCGTSVKLAPGESWTGKTEFQVVDTPSA